MSTGMKQSLTWQFGLTWMLAEYHLGTLTDEMCLWEPSKNSWSVRRSENGVWRPDFSEIEPTPIPTVTIGWLTWQIIWWWKSALNVVDDKLAIASTDVPWPGSAQAAKQEIEALKTKWESLLNAMEEADFDRKISHLWPEPTPFWQTATWVNSELMKNISELGYVRFLYENR